MERNLTTKAAKKMPADLGNGTSFWTWAIGGLVAAVTTLFGLFRGTLTARISSLEEDNKQIKQEQQECLEDRTKLKVQVARLETELGIEESK